jgi:predicted nucleic acid-binding protein
VTHLLDTSAILAHLLDEPGADKITRLLARGKDQVALAAPSWAELDRRLGELIPDPAEARRIRLLYTRDLCALVPLDEAAANAAITLQQKAARRIPLIDALIAGCAASRQLTLVHRDEYLDQIPAGQLATLRLPAKRREDDSIR